MYRIIAFFSLLLSLSSCGKKKCIETPSYDTTKMKGLSMAYKVQEHLKPKKLDGISDEQIITHWKLYEGYVAQVNKLHEELKDLTDQGKVDTPLYADRRRRFGFEYNGMVLHEYYFGNMKIGSNSPDSTEIKKAIEEQWGSFETWRRDFEAAGKSRSIGWAILYGDTSTGALSNHFIQEHEDGNIAGFSPILVLDVWEHAYMVDYGTAGRGKYIAAFMNNIDWNVVDERFKALKAGKIASRF